MPLVRYEVRCEHSLANPELYRSAARDDPESLLEGVAMAGLVGIVRQLGDLAEFAAEIFCSLHDELMTIGSRGHDLNMRVQQLEDELPVVEKALLSEPNQLRFAYTNGADWHASIRSDQNHCTSGDLPRFVRNYYEECRGPPQLFLLDKFDMSGVGACLKRYTDPSFFKLEWASTELMRAQREQRDKRARRDKKKGRKRRTGEPIAAINQIPARVRYGSASLEDLEGLPHDIASALKFDVPAPSRLGGIRESGTQTPRDLPRDPKDTLVEGPNTPALKPFHVSAVSNTSEGVKYSKISDKDTGSANDSGNVLKPDEPEGTASILAGRMSRIIDQEDHAAAPAKVHTGALDSKGLESADGFEDVGGNGHVQSVDSKATNGISRDDSGAASMPRSVRTPVATPRGAAKGEFTMDVREGEKPSPGKFPVGTDSPMLLQSFSRRSIYMDALDSGRLSGKFLWRNNVDGNESSPLGGRFSREVSMARSGSEYDEFVDAPSRIVSEGESDFDSPGSVHKVTQFNGDALNHAALKNHVEAQKAEIPSGMKLMEQQQPIPIADKLADASEVVPEENLQLKDNSNARALLKHPSPRPTLLHDDPPASDTPVGDVLSPIQQSRVPKGDGRSGELLKAFPTNGNGDSHIQVAPAKDVPERTEETNLISSMVSSPTPSSLGSSSSATSPTRAGRAVLQPSFSMFSRHSYSSELISVSSDSELNPPTSQNSPTSPTSPAFHALYSPRGEPRSLNYIVKSPPTTYLASYSPGTNKSNQSSSSLEEVPVLSQSPTSFSRSSHLEHLDHLDLVEDSLPIAGNPVKPESRLPSRPRLQLYPLPSPPTMSPEPDHPSKSREFSYPITGGFGGPASPPQNGDSGHIKVFDEGDVHPDLQLSPTSKPDIVTQLEEPAIFDESVPPPVISSKAGVIPSSPERGTPRFSTFSESTRSSLVLPRVVGSPVSSAPSSPIGSPKMSFQRIFLSSPSALASPSPLRNISDDVNRCRSLGDEDSTPSSPSGSVIIKDSPPDSPRSSYTGSECESRDFDAIQGRPETSGPAGCSSNAMEESVSRREADVDDVGSVVSLRLKSSEIAARTSPDKGHNLLLSPTSKQSDMAIEISSKFSLDSSVSNGSPDHSVSQERISPSRSPSIRPQVDPLPATLKPISTVRTTKSYKSLTSNSPPDSPSGRDLAQSTNSIQWRGKAVPPSTPPRAAFKLPHHPPLRSPLRSPLLTPKSFFSETGTLKWLGRLDPGLSPKPDFSLPPNLVCHSETSSPVCSPPPQLDLDSPAKSDIISEPSVEGFDSPPTTSIHLHSSGDFSNPPASTSFVNADDFPSFKHDSEEDFGDGNVKRQDEPQRVELSATSNSGPSHSSSSSLEGVRSSEAVDVEEFRVLTRVAEIEQLCTVPIGGAIGSNHSLPTTSSANTVSDPDEENGSESHLGVKVDVDEADQSMEKSSVSLSREAEGNQELESLSSVDAKVRSTYSQQASPSLLPEEPESTFDLAHTSDARVCAAASHDQNLSLTSCDHISESIHERADVSIAAEASSEHVSPSPLEKENKSRDFGPMNEAVGAAHAIGKASSFPLEEADSRNLDEQALSDLVDGARFQTQLPLDSPSQELTVAGPNSASATDMGSSIAAQSDKEVLPALSTSEPVDRDESAPLHRTEVTPAKVQSLEDALNPQVTSESELRTTPNTKAALEAAIARHDRNMLKELTFQEPVLRPRPSTDERSLLIDQIRTTSFNLRRTEGSEKKEFVPRPVTNINVAAILEKANAIRQAFAGSDDDDDGDDDWSDS